MFLVQIIQNDNFSFKTGILFHLNSLHVVLKMYQKQFYKKYKTDRRSFSFMNYREFSNVV